VISRVSTFCRTAAAGSFDDAIRLSFLSKPAGITENRAALPSLITECRTGPSTP
jgi:hypothetical protein